MKRREMLPLFFINFIVYFVGTGLLPVLPLFASQFGITSTGIGLYIAFIFAAITLGTLFTGRIAYRFSPRGIFLAAGFLGIPALALLGRSTSFWQAILLTAVIWFLGGVGTALVNVQAGQYAARNQRGRSFGLMFLALPAASLISGMTIGRLVEWQSYRFMFDVLSVIWATWIVWSMLLPSDRPEQRPTPIPAVADSGHSKFGVMFYLLVATTLLSATTFYLTRLGTTFSLSALGFSPSAISSTTSVGGLIAIPATYLISALSDRLSRKHIITVGYVFAVGATVTMSTADQLWQFWLATSLLYMSRSINGSVAPALATDLLTRENLVRGIPYLSAANWMAAIFGSAIAGIGIDSLGQVNLFLLAAGLAAMAAVLMTLSSLPHHHQVQPLSNPQPGR
ncbi:MAG: MFS transporter [Chloroflexi bacterium]|jgi:predicted MFS family arabinose efflux permease|nr:MFS transporter [Chloroflexota bacterium]